jgi:hypothetical protein
VVVSQQPANFGYSESSSDLHGTEILHCTKALPENLSYTNMEPGARGLSQAEQLSCWPDLPISCFGGRDPGISPRKRCSPTLPIGVCCLWGDQNQDARDSGRPRVDPSYFYLCRTASCMVALTSQANDAAVLLPQKDTKTTNGSARRVTPPRSQNSKIE